MPAVCVKHLYVILFPVSCVCVTVDVARKMIGLEFWGPRCISHKREERPCDKPYKLETHASFQLDYLACLMHKCWPLIFHVRFLMLQINCLLTYSMVQIPSWEANWFAASQEIPRISWNPKVHYRTHKRRPTFPILGQSNPVHIPTSHLLEIHPNIIHPSTPRSPQWSPSLRFPQQDPIQPLLLTHTRHMPSPSHSSRFYHVHIIG